MRIQIRVDPKSVEEIKNLPQFMKNGLNGAINEFVGHAANIAVETAQQTFYSGQDPDTGYDRNPYRGDAANAIYIDRFRGIRGKPYAAAAEVVADAGIAPQAVFFEHDLDSETSMAVLRDTPKFRKWLLTKTDSYERGEGRYQTNRASSRNPYGARTVESVMKKIRAKRQDHPFKGRYHMLAGLNASRTYLSHNQRTSAQGFNFAYRAGARPERKTGDFGETRYAGGGMIEIDAKGKESLAIRG